MIWIIFGIIVVLLLIILSAFFSSSEMAFISINRAFIANKVIEGNKKAQILQQLLKDPANVISAIIIGNNLVNISSSILAGFIVSYFFGNIGIGIATVLMFFLLLIFGESIPKSYGLHNEKFVLKIAGFLLLITNIFHPIVLLLTSLAKKVNKIFGKTEKPHHITEQEIIAMMRLGESEGTIEKDEREMVSEVFEFDETIVHEILTPKSNIVFIQEDEPIKSLIEKSLKHGFSRFPVYKNDYDDIIGMVHIKDTLLFKDENLPVKNIIRPILKVDYRMKADDVLREMKKSKTHLAILQNKEGKTLGLVSMEDLIEEIFGEITDEHDLKT
ncbi:MAG: hemolysin family protein [Candidatus Thermoplasmatota archaeon]|nr:hemolysin family protein [Candidatus Thermoplasmatota archaeon]